MPRFVCVACGYRVNTEVKPAACLRCREKEFLAIAGQKEVLDENVGDEPGRLGHRAGQD